VAIPAPIDNTVASALFSVGWRGDALDFTLRRPDGVYIGPGDVAGDTLMDYQSGDAFGLYTVRAPQPGIWAMEIRSGGTTAYTAAVSAETDLTLDAQFYRSVSEAGRPVTALISVAENGIPITGATVRAVVRSPGTAYTKWTARQGDTAPATALRRTSADTLVLYDDGYHGDGEPEDGVYGVTYLDTEQAGSYVFHIHATGRTLGGASFSRLTQRSLFIDQPTDQSAITGWVAYSGDQGGVIYVRAWTHEPDRTGLPPYVDAVEDTVFILDNLAEGEYILDAFLDMDGDGVYDENEPYGRAYAPIAVIEPVVIQDVVIQLDADRSMIAVSPNPFAPARGHGEITFFGSGVPLATIAVYTIAGDPVVTLRETRGDSRLGWDATTGTGQRAASGVYLWVATVRGKTRIGKLVIIH
jgi:hypothetical protein